MRVSGAVLVAVITLNGSAYAGEELEPSSPSSFGSSQPWSVQLGGQAQEGRSSSWGVQASPDGSRSQGFGQRAVEPSTGSLNKREYLGNLSANPYGSDSTANPYGAGSPYRADGVKNPFGTYGSPYSSKSATNPFATDAPKLYDSEGNYRGKLSTNPYDPESTSNPYGRYGSQSSPDSINNPYGAGSPYRSDSPTNPYGKGMKIYGE